MEVDGSFTIVIGNAVCDLPAQFVELSATFVEIILRLSFLSHSREERLDCGVELVSQLWGDDLDPSGHLQGVDTVDVVQLMQHQSRRKVCQLHVPLLKLLLLSVIQHDLASSRDTQPETWIPAALLPFFFNLGRLVSYLRIQIGLKGGVAQLGIALPLACP